MTYDMPRDLYDETDDVDHPILVVALDPVRREAIVVTRTTKWEARGKHFVAHAPAPELGLNKLGWWRLDPWNHHRVPCSSFDPRDVGVRGALDDRTWERVKNELAGTEEER